MTTTANQDPRLEAIQYAKACASMGTDGYYRISQFYPRYFVVTSGIRALAEAAGCYWLIDAIASHQPTIQRSR